MACTAHEAVRLPCLQRAGLFCSTPVPELVLPQIDMEYRELAEDSGITHWGRVPALNTDPVWIQDLAELVVEQLPSAAPRPDPVADLNLGPPSGGCLQCSAVLLLRPCCPLRLPLPVLCAGDEALH